MGWREQSRKASYFGFEFLAEDVTNSVQRQSTSHEIPNSNFPRVQDSGIANREISVNAYFIGDDYINQRNFLENLLLTRGGDYVKLILPTRNEVYVKVLDYQTKWSNVNGGMETISINFIEVAVETPRIFETSSESDVTSNGEVVEESTIESFVDDVILSKLPSFVVNDMFTKYKELTKSVGKYTAIAQDVIQEVSKLKTDPLGYVAGIVDMFGGVQGTFSDLRGSYFALKSFVGFAFSTSDSYSDTNNARRIQKNNATELDLAITNIAVEKMSEIAISIGYDSRAEAVEIRDDMVSQFDIAIGLISDADKAEMYDDMIRLKSSFIKFMNENGASLPQVKSISSIDSLPSVFISNNEYGNIDLADDIVLRNNVENSLFMPAQQPIEVLVL